VVDQPQVLGGDPGPGELLVGGVTGVEPGQQPSPRSVGVVIVAAAQQPADAVERITGTAAVPALLALDAAADLVDGGEAEPHHVEGVQHPYCVGQRGAQR
jgi:hypothetical protein